MARILLTNDDGYRAPGLLALRALLKKKHEVCVCAPQSEQSGASHSLTLRKPIKVRRVKPSFFAIRGTPTDCVLLAHHHLLPVPPDVIISGINHGPNMGDDVFYSGTVAAAIQGALLGIPSLAVSLASFDSDDYGPAAEWIEDFLDQRSDRLRRREILNINIPAGKPSRAIVTRLGKRIYHDEVIKREGTKGATYCVIDGTLSFELEEGTDFKAVADGFISITPLSLDLTDHTRILSYRASIT